MFVEFHVILDEEYVHGIYFLDRHITKLYKC